MPNPWNGYVAVTDDVRHTYEQVFYGRQLTDDWKPINAPGAAPGTPGSDAPGIEAPPIGPGSAPTGGVWGETLPPETGQGGLYGTAQIEAPTIDGSATPIAGQVSAPSQAPAGGLYGPAQVEAPTIEPASAPSAGNDLTPG